MPEKVYINFTKVKSATPEIYLIERLKNLFGSKSFGSKERRELPHPKKIKRIAREFMKSIPERTEPLMAAPLDVNAFNKDKRLRLPNLVQDKRFFRRFHKRYRLHYTCMTNTIEGYFPPADGEVIIKEDLSYLKEAWNGFPDNVITLRRETNYSIAYYVFPEVEVDLKNVGLIFTQSQKTLASVSTLAVDTDPNIDFGGSALTLATGLVGNAPAPYNTIGAALLTAFWPKADSSANMWKEVYAALEEIVRLGLNENDIDMASAKAQSISLWLNDTYKNMNNDPTKTPEMKIAALESKDEIILNEIMSVLWFKTTLDSFPDKLAAQALANFMLAANLHLGVLQEMAIQETLITPSPNTYYNSIKDYARDYNDYAKARAPFIKELRMDQISDLLDETTTNCSGGATNCTTTTFFWWEDSNPPYTSSLYSSSGPKDKINPKVDADMNRTRYIGIISDDMDKILNDEIIKVADTWLQLIVEPLPEPIY